LTKKPKYYDAVSRVTRLMTATQNQTKLPGIWPTCWNVQIPDLISDNVFTLGALADSLYEYLPKMHVLLGGREPIYGTMYNHAAEAIKDKLLLRPMTFNGEDILFSGTVWVDDHGHRLNPEGQHLACFAGGMFGLGGKLLDIPEHVDLGMKLTKGCIWAYRAFPTGIMPEYFNTVICESLEGCPWDEQH
jgi:mannosyl-oligosaccharide alpha-1,2-mannosidase